MRIILACILAACLGALSGCGPRHNQSPRPSKVRPDKDKAILYKDLGIAELENAGTKDPSPPAIADFRKVQQYAPADPLGYMDEALAISRGNSTPRNIRMLSADVIRGIQLAPRSAEVLLLAAQILYHSGMSTFDNATFARARAYLNQSLLLNPASATAHWEWLREEARGSDPGSTAPASALPHLLAIQKLIPDNLLAVAHLAEVYVRLHQPERAEGYLRQWRVLEWDGSPQLRTYLDQTGKALQAHDFQSAEGAIRFAHNVSLNAGTWQSAQTELYPGADGIPLTLLQGETRLDSPIGPAIPVSFVDATQSMGLAGAGGSAGVESFAIGSLVPQPMSTIQAGFHRKGSFPLPDLLLIDRAGTIHIWHNAGSHFVEDPSLAQIPTTPGTYPLLADFEPPGGNKFLEEHPLDLLLLSARGSRFLYRPIGGKFEDKTAETRLGGLKGTVGAALDIDHDGLLDVIAGGAGPGLQIYAGRGNGAFESGAFIKASCRTMMAEIVVSSRTPLGRYSQSPLPALPLTLLSPTSTETGPSISMLPVEPGRESITTICVRDGSRTQPQPQDSVISAPAVPRPRRIGTMMAHRIWLWAA